MEFQIGTTFPSFKDFTEKFEQFCVLTNSLFVRRTSVKIKDPNLSHLEFEAAGYVCKQGKANHASKSAGARPNQKSFKIGCAASFRLICVRPQNGDAPHLKISKADFTHSGHETSAHMLSLYPERRRIEITSDVRMIAKTSLKASEVKAIVEKTQGVRLRPQDIKNLRLKLKGETSDSSIVDSLLGQLKNDGGHATFSVDPEGSLSYLCFLTKEMLGMLQRFPHVLLLDFTYKTNKYLMPLLTVMAIDHYGHGCPVLHAYVRNEDSQYLKEVLSFFATLYDPNETACFIIDKDFSEINALGAVFPNARINLCHFHISQAVSRHLKKLATAMATTVHDLFMRQVTTESMEEYGALRTQLQTILPEASVTYFQNNWWSCPDRWATAYNVGTLKLDATTTNHLESFHGKIKNTLRLEMGLGDNINFLISYTRELFTKFMDSTVLDSNMRRYKTTNPDAEAVFGAGISTFIAENILRELNLAKTIQYIVRHVGDNDTYEVVYKDSVKQATPSSCDCRFHKSMRLPCRHIFFLRTHLNIDVFDTSLVGTMHFLGGTSASSTRGTVTSCVSNVRPVSVSTQEARYRRASKLCQEISVYLSVLGESEFLDKYNYLCNLLSSWKGDVPDSLAVDTVAGMDGSLYFAPVTDAPVHTDHTSASISVFIPPLSTSSEVSADTRGSLSVGGTIQVHSPPVSVDSGTCPVSGPVHSLSSSPLSSEVPLVSADTGASLSAGGTIQVHSPPVSVDSGTCPVSGPVHSLSSSPLSSEVPLVSADTGASLSAGGMIQVHSPLVSADSGTCPVSGPVHSLSSSPLSSEVPLVSADTGASLSAGGTIQVHSPLVSADSGTCPVSGPVHSLSSSPLSSEVPPVSSDTGTSLSVAGPVHSLSSSPPSSEVAPVSVATDVSFSVAGQVHSLSSSPLSSEVAPVSANTDVSFSVVGQVHIQSSSPLSPEVPPVSADTGACFSGAGPVHVLSSSPLASGVPPADAPSSPSFTSVQLKRCRVKGRPKKQLFTRKRKCKLPQGFAGLSLSEKKVIILKSVLRDECFVDEAMIIQPAMLRQQYTDTVLDDMVVLNTVADNFSSSAVYDDFCRSVVNMRRLQIFHCGTCQLEDDGEEKMIQCERCLFWFHFSCVGYKSIMKIKNWFCCTCWSTV